MAANACVTKGRSFEGFAKGVCLLPIAALLAACSHPDSPNEENFTRAINIAIQGKQACPPLARYPIDTKWQGDLQKDVLRFEEPVDKSKSPWNGKWGDANYLAFHAALAKAGILRQLPVWFRPKQSFIGEDDYIHDFQITDLGRKYVQLRPQIFLKPRAYLCVAHPVVAKIISWTTPENADSMTMTEVRYQKKYEVADWVRSEPFKSAWPWTARSAERLVNDKIVLVHTNKGWAAADQQ